MTEWERETLAERLELVADANEGTAKWLLQARWKDGALYAEVAQELTQMERKGVLFFNLLWQTARMIEAVLEVAREWEIDVEHGREVLRQALAGTLYEPEEGSER